MISFYATTPHLYTFDSFRQMWARELIEDSRLVGYSEIELGASIEPGLHVFTDFERLLGPERGLAKRWHRLISTAGPAHAALGDPGRWKDRHRLLTALADAGINDFRSHRIDQLGPQIRYPVFLRWANEHTGSLGGPIASEAQLRDRLSSMTGRRRRHLAHQLLVVELVDARSADGLFRKYSVQRIGDDLIPRHLVVDRHWVTKGPTVVTDDIVAEEQRFIDDPPNLDLVREAFAIAGIDFGRIDYGYVGGRLQVWEINTNPMLAPRHAADPRRQTVMESAAARQVESLRRLVPVQQHPARPLPALERWWWSAVQAGGRRWDPRRR